MWIYHIINDIDANTVCPVRKATFFTNQGNIGLGCELASKAGIAEPHVQVS